MYSFGTVLLDLLSGKHIPPSHVGLFVSFTTFFSCMTQHNTVLLDLYLLGIVNIVGYMYFTYLEIRYKFEYKYYSL